MGCASIPKLETVYESGGVEVQLRTNRADPEDLFQHPVEVSAAALSALLGEIQVDNPSRRKDEPLPGVHPDILERVSEGASLALAKADSQQTVAVTAIFRERKLLVLHRKYLTTFNLYRVDDRLYVDFSRVQWEIPRNWRKDKIPRPNPGDPGMKIDVIEVPGRVATENGHLAIIDWQPTTTVEAGFGP